MKHLEDNIQAACCRWFAYQYPHLLLFAIPNGGKRDAREAARLKRQGVVPGIPDLMLAYPAKDYHGLFIEIKSEKGRISKEQAKKLKQLIDEGYLGTIIHSVDEFIQVVTEYLK